MLEIIQVTPESRDLDLTISVAEAASLTGFSKLTVINRLSAAEVMPVARLVRGAGRPTNLFERQVVEALMGSGMPRPRKSVSAQAALETATEASTEA